MKLAFATACLVASLSLATNALADGRTVATLAQPVAKKMQFIVKGGIWDCADTTCVADITPDETFDIDECHQVARKAGVAVIDFKDDAKALQTASLERCNAGLTPKSSITASR